MPIWHPCYFPLIRGVVFALNLRMLRGLELRFNDSLQETVAPLPKNESILSMLKWDIGTLTIDLKIAV